MLLQLYLAQKANLDEDTKGGICVILAAINPQTMYPFKTTEYLTRYWKHDKASSLNAIIFAMRNIDRTRTLSIEFMSQESLNLDEINMLRSTPISKKPQDHNIFDLFPQNVQLITPKSRPVNKLATRCQTAAEKIAFFAHSCTDGYLAICPKCFTSHDGDTARMFGWECDKCDSQLIDI